MRNAWCKLIAGILTQFLYCEQQMSNCFAQQDFTFTVYQPVGLSTETIMLQKVPFAGQYVVEP